MSESSRVAYDARLGLGKYRGMGRFLRLLIEGNERRFIGLCADGEHHASLHLVAAGLGPYPLWEQVSIPRQLRKLSIGTLIAPYNTAPLRLPKAVKLVLVVHDLIFMDRLPFSKSLYQNVGRWYRKFIVPRALQRADVIVTVSNHTAQQLVSRYGLDRSRIHIIPNSIGQEWFDEKNVSAAMPRYVLAVAGEAPSKKLRRAIAAFAQCRRMGKDPVAPKGCWSESKVSPSISS